MPQAALTDQDLEQFDRLPPPPGPFRALCLGRHLHWKGFHLAIRAFAQFAKTNRDAELWIVHTGPFRAELEKTAARSGSEKRRQPAFASKFLTHFGQGPSESLGKTQD